jgi:hypothetical protein
VLIFLTCSFLSFAEPLEPAFVPAEIPPAILFHPEWEAPSVSFEKDLFAYPYVYLGKGKQCQAFESTSGKYVIKFLSFCRKNPPQRIQQIEKNLGKIASHYLLAFTAFQQETGLIDLHLNRTENYPSIRVKDAFGVKYTIDLNTTAFVIQRRAKPFEKTILEWAESNEFDKARKGLSDLLHLFATRSSHGLEDPESHFEGNFGFLDERPVQIDVGHLKKRRKQITPEEEKKQLRKLLSPFQKELSKRFPQLGEHLEAELANNNDWSHEKNSIDQGNQEQDQEDKE